MKNNIISFRIFKGEDGFYVAENEKFAIFTQGKTFEELIKNIREATEVSFDELGVTTTKDEQLPPIMMNIDFSDVAYA